MALESEPRRRRANLEFVSKVMNQIRGGAEDGENSPESRYLGGGMEGRACPENSEPRSREERERTSCFPFPSAQQPLGKTKQSIGWKCYGPNSPSPLAASGNRLQNPENNTCVLLKHHIWMGLLRYTPTACHEAQCKFYCNLTARNPEFSPFDFYSSATMHARITHHTARNFERHSSLPSLSSAEPYNTALAPSEFQPSIRKSNLTSPCPLGIGCPFESQSERSL